MNIDKNEEEIPSITVKTDEEYAEIVEKLRWKPTFYKISQFFIADLLRAEKVDDATFFRWNNVDFKTVKVRGIVAGIGSTATKNFITVDDGTAQIDCVLQTNEKLKILKATVDEALCESEIKNDKGSVILLFRCKRKLEALPTEISDVKLGQTVVLVGNLSEFYENRTIYVKHISIIANCDSTEEVQFFRMLFDSYENNFI